MKRWLVVAVLMVASVWMANVTLFNWWAAGGPPTPNPQQFETRGNVFAIVTLLLLSAAVAVALLNRKKSLHQ